MFYVPERRYESPRQKKNRPIASHTPFNGHEDQLFRLVVKNDALIPYSALESFSPIYSPLSLARDTMLISHPHGTHIIITENLTV